MIDVPAEELRRRLAAVVPVPWVVDEAVARAPLADFPSLLAAVAESIGRLSGDELTDAARRLAAITPEPPGEAGLASAAEGADAARARGDRVYAERFGRPFLLDGADRTGDEVVEELQRRLTNSPDEEADETRRQLRLLVESALRRQFAKDAR